MPILGVPSTRPTLQPPLLCQRVTPTRPKNWNGRPTCAPQSHPSNNQKKVIVPRTRGLRNVGGTPNTADEHLHNASSWNWRIPETTQAESTLMNGQPRNAITEPRPLARLEGPRTTLSWWETYSGWPSWWSFIFIFCFWFLKVCPAGFPVSPHSYFHFFQLRYFP